jgi:hypothetical protein
MILLLLIMSAPVAALFCQNSNSLYPFLGPVNMQPASHRHLECIGGANLVISAPFGRIEITSKTRNWTRFTYTAPALPAIVLARGLEITCSSATDKCFWYVNFDFPLQILALSRMIEVPENTEVNISNPFLAPERSHRYTQRIFNHTDWTNYTIKPLKMVVRGDTQVNFELRDLKENKTFVATTNLKTKTRTTTTPPPPPAAPTHPIDDLAHLIAALVVYFIILCVSELLRYFTNKH